MQTPLHELVVRVMPNGSVSVSGPIHDKFLCYAMLECAKDSVRNHVTKLQAEAPLVQVAHRFLPT